MMSDGRTLHRADVMDACYSVFGNRNEGAESLLAPSAIAYARTRNASPTPSSAESPSNTTTPGKPANANTTPPQVTPTVPPRKLHVFTKPEPLPDWVSGNAATAMRGADA